MSGVPRRPQGVGFERAYDAVPASVGAARSELIRFGRRQRLPDATIEAATLATSEAATNVIVHAYAERGERGQFTLTAALAGSELWVIVADSGSGLRPRRNSPGLGLGLAIIARVADGVDLVTSASDAATIVLDLSGLTFIDSTGLRIVLDFNALCGGLSGRLSVIAGTPAVDRLLDIVGLRDQLPLIAP